MNTSTLISPNDNVNIPEMVAMLDKIEQGP